MQGMDVFFILFHYRCLTSTLENQGPPDVCGRGGRGHYCPRGERDQERGNAAGASRYWPLGRFLFSKKNSETMDFIIKMRMFHEPILGNFGRLVFGWILELRFEFFKNDGQKKLDGPTVSLFSLDLPQSFQMLRMSCVSLNTGIWARSSKGIAGFSANPRCADVLFGRHCRCHHLGLSRCL